MALDSHVGVPTGREAIRQGLDDFMWMEILSRLPSTKDVFQCKCVSKRWNSLISDRYFIPRFIEHNYNKYGSDFNSELLLFFHDYNKDSVGLLACSDDGKGSNQAAGSILPLPTYKVENSCNDLLVCSETTSLTYYIVNPFTKEHVELPRHDLDGPYHLRFHGIVGFVCEPLYGHGGRRFDPVTNYRYRVIRIIDSHYFGDCRIAIYCSEAKQWSRLTGLDRSRYGCFSNVVAHGGKLYWYNHSGEVVAYNPFVASGERDFKFLGLNETRTFSGGSRLAQSQGSLLFMQLTRHNGDSYMSIWKKLEEEEEEAGLDDREAFRFERTVALNYIISDTCPNFIRNGDILLALGVHPSNRDVIFLGYEKSPRVASYNLGTKEWQELGEIHQQINDGNCSLFHEFGVPANLPWWPTPVH